MSSASIALSIRQNESKMDQINNAAISLCCVLFIFPLTLLPLPSPRLLPSATTRSRPFQRRYRHLCPVT